MKSVGMPRCCGNCGRWGNRAYRRDDEREEWVCSNDRACERRAVRFRAAYPAEDQDQSAISTGAEMSNPRVILFSTTLNTWEIWQTGRPVGHGTLEACQRFAPDALPVSQRQLDLAARAS